MKKDIICVRFKQDTTVEEASKFYKNIYEVLKKDYYVVGVFEQFIDVESITSDTKIIHINGRHYSAKELIDIVGSNEGGLKNYKESI